MGRRMAEESKLSLNGENSRRFSILQKKRCIQRGLRRVTEKKSLWGGGSEFRGRKARYAK